MAWSRMPKTWRPKPLAFFFRQTIGFAHARLVYLWPDQLGKSHWLKRCQLKLDSNLEKRLQSERPIVFASFHFGPFRTLPYWLRAHGIAVTTLVGTPISRESAMIDALSPPPEVPVLAWVNDMKEIRKSVGPGRRLLILIDVDHAKQTPVTMANEVFRLTTGAVRLAAATGADLIPCVIVEKDVWNFVIHFGSPVPQAFLGKSPDVPAATSHLLGELLPVMLCHPVQCRHRFLSSITPAGQTNPDL